MQNMYLREIVFPQDKYGSSIVVILLQQLMKFLFYYYSSKQDKTEIIKQSIASCE